MKLPRLRVIREYVEPSTVHEERVAEVLTERGGMAPPKVVAMLDWMGDEYVELMVVVLLNARGMPMGFFEISRGTTNTTLVHPREVFLGAVREGASGIILVHNHPTGDDTPSPEDWAVTRRIADCGRLLGISLVDHIVLGRRSSDGAIVHTSMRYQEPDVFAK